MDWGLLQGLGAGLQKLGGMKLEEDAEVRRTQLAEKLQKEREERAKLAFDPQQTTLEQGEGGAWFQVKRNKNGDVMGRDLAPKNEIDKIEREAKKEGLSIESLQAQILASKTATEVNKKELEWGEQDRGLLTPAERAAAMKVKGGLLPSADTKYSTDASIQRTFLTESGKASRADDDVDNTTIADYADAYLDENPGVAASFIDTKILTENQAKDAVIQVLREFSKRGVKPTQADFNAALNSYAKKLPKASGTVGLSLKGNNG